MMPFFNPVSFVDREEELSRLTKMISFYVNEEVKPSGYQRVMHLVGKSRVGKSFLLNKFGYELSQRETVFPLCITLKEYIGFSRDKFILEILQDIDRVVSTELKVKPQLLVETSVVSQYSEWVFRGIEQVERKKIFVLLLDEVDALSFEQIQSLEDYLLDKILSLPNVIVVLSGRHLITGWREFVLRPDKVNVIELSDFDYENTKEQIRAINPSFDNLVEVIHKISGGSPGNNMKIVGQLGDPSQFTEQKAINISNKEIKDSLTSIGGEGQETITSELQHALEALCVLQDFDKEYEMPIMLSAHPALNGDWTVQRCSELLHNLSKVQVGSGKLIDWGREENALVMEEQTRFSLEKELIMRDKELWKTLHCTAMKMYNIWAKQFGPESIFADKADFHKDQLENAGFNPSECNII